MSVVGEGALVKPVGEGMAHQPSCGLEQILDRDQAVVAQGPASGHKVHDRLRHSCNRPQLHRAIEVHQLNGKIQGVEVLPGAMGELAGHSAMGRQIGGTGIATALLYRHGHPATAKAQVNQLGTELMLLSTS